MDWKPTAFQTPATLSETIYQSLKKAIIDGDIRPGQRLQEKEVAALFHASATPVREAFFRLSAEKYLTINARREVLVNHTTLEDVRELYAIVRALDKLAVRTVVAAISEDDIRALKDMTAQLSRHYGARDAQLYLDMNLKIHDKIWEACGNKFLYDILAEVMAKIAIYRRHTDFSPFSDPPALEKSHHDHLNLIALIEARDLAGLERLIDSHWGEEFFVGHPVGTTRTKRERRR